MAGMQFTFFGPLKTIAGRDGLRVDHDDVVSLRTLALDHLPEHLGNIFPYGKATTDVQLRANLSFYREGKSLKLDDLVRAEDTVMVMLAIAGG
jgi:hypothetical protein